MLLFQENDCYQSLTTNVTLVVIADRGEQVVLAEMEGRKITVSLERKDALNRTFQHPTKKGGYIVKLLGNNPGVASEMAERILKLSTLNQGHILGNDPLKASIIFAALERKAKLRESKRGKVQ
jgi:hypothetical protein